MSFVWSELLETAKYLQLKPVLTESDARTIEVSTGNSSDKERPYPPSEGRTMTIQIYEIASQMCREGLDERFVSAVVKGAFESEAIANAMIFWTHAVTQEKKDRRVALLSELVENIDDETTAEIEINCINSMQVVAEIQKFKATLKAKIEASVGISGLSKEIGIPVPGIRAFLESSARPRKMTLEKIRHALHLPQSDLSCPFAV